MEEDMKVLIINGSPHKDGTTAGAISELVSALESDGVDCEVVHIGLEPVRGCVACLGCNKGEGCALGGIVNEIAEKFKEADGLVVASPVYYAAPNATLVALLDRLFYSARFDKRDKVGAAIACARRGGTTAALDVLNKYFSISGMPIVGSTYWNQVHGANSADDAKADAEGMLCMRTLGHNMAFLIKSIALGKEKYGLPEKEKQVRTNFIKR